MATKIHKEKREDNKSKAERYAASSKLHYHRADLKKRRNKSRDVARRRGGGELYMLYNFPW